MSEYVVAITGASGAVYAKRVIYGILAGGHTVSCVVSPAARRVLAIEEGVTLEDTAARNAAPLLEWVGMPDVGRALTVYEADDVAARIASGSAKFSGMAVVPCSGGSLARIAYGISSGLIERAAEVCLKERRTLVLMPRETPISLVHARNLETLLQAGAWIAPASPGFYHRPRSIMDLVDMVAGRILSILGVDTDMLKAWRGAAPGDTAARGDE